jgi:hypothetical protein
MKGFIISSRPSEVAANKFSKTGPFISRVTNKEPLGLPYIRNKDIYEFNHYKLPNFIDLKNKEIVKKIQRLKKIEKDFIMDEERNVQIKKEKIKKISDKFNKDYNEIRRQLYGEKYPQSYGVSKSIDKPDLTTLKKKTLISNTYGLQNEIENFYSKENQKELEDFKKTNNYDANFAELPLIKKEENKNDPLAEDGDNDETEDLLNFVSNLDYEKYVKDLEIKEALYLIKNKVEKDEEIKHEENPKENDGLKNEQENENENKENDKGENKNTVYYNPVIHEKEWDNSVLILFYIGQN